MEGDADVIALLIRHEYYEPGEEMRAVLEGHASLLVAKQPYGPVGEVPLTFRKEFMRFEDRTN